MPKTDLGPLAERDDIILEYRTRFDPNGPEFEPNTGANERNQMGREMIQWMRNEFGLRESDGLLTVTVQQLRWLKGNADYWEASLQRMIQRLSNTGSQA